MKTSNTTNLNEVLTASRTLFNSGLFVVRAGATANDALQEASVLLAAARDVAVSLTQHHDDRAYAVYCLLDMAKALIDATVKGAMEHQQDPLAGTRKGGVE